MQNELNFYSVYIISIMWKAIYEHNSIRYRFAIEIGIHEQTRHNSFIFGWAPKWYLSLHRFSSNSSSHLSLSTVLSHLQAIGRTVRFSIRLIGVNPNSTGSQKIRKKPGLCIISDVMSCLYQTNKESLNLTNDSPSISSQIFLVTSSPTYALAIASLKLRLLTSLVRRKNGGDTICPASMCLWLLCLSP